MSKLFATVLFILSATTVFAQNISVDDVSTIYQAAREGQSAVIPPGSVCKDGGLFFSLDATRPPEKGQTIVVGRTLATPGQTITSSFDMGSLAAKYSDDLTKTNYYFGTNDHDLIALPSGELLYLTGAFNRTPIIRTPPPAWAQHTFRTICTQLDGAGNCRKTYDFGPNARSVLLVWRSTDCGQTFQFVSELDPAKMEDGSCAMPQFRKDSKQSPTPESRYDMGGTDGQLVKVDPSNGNLYLTFQCVGYKQDNSVKNEFKLSTDALDETLVAASYDKGSTWKSLGFMPGTNWRFGIVPLSANKLAFGFPTSILIGTKNSSGKYAYPNGAQPLASSTDWGWDNFDSSRSPRNLIKDNMWANTVMERTPGSGHIVLAFPDTIPGKGNGYRLFFYNPQNGEFAEAENPILPASQNSDDFITHLTMVTAGADTPVLLYWYDFNSSTKTATIRGRLVTGEKTTGEDKYTDDFVISRDGGKERDFPFKYSHFFYGDYHTAGGFAEPYGLQQTGRLHTPPQGYNYIYYPTWVEPDDTIRYAMVRYSVPFASATTTRATQDVNLRSHLVGRQRWKPTPPPVERSLYTGREIEEIRDYSAVKREKTAPVTPRKPVRPPAQKPSVRN